MSGASIASTSRGCARSHEGSAQILRDPPADVVLCPAAATVCSLRRHWNAQRHVAVHNQDAGRWSRELMQRLDSAGFITKLRRVDDTVRCAA